MPEQIAESKRLCLEVLNVEDHLQGFHALNRDEKVSKWSHRPPTISLADAKTLLLTRLPSPEKPWQENYAIVLKPSVYDGDRKKEVEGEGGGGGRMIGVIGIPRLSHDELAAEVGYGILVEEWGMGFASEALGMFVRWYFCSARPHQKEALVAETEPENTASEKVLSKAGFKRGELVRGAFEVTDVVTGEKRMQDAIPWRYERPL